MIGEAIMTGKPKVEPNVLLFRYFEDYGISLSDVAEKTGYKLTYLKNLRNGSNELTDAAKFRFIRHYPDTIKFFIPRWKN